MEEPAKKYCPKCHAVVLDDKCLNCGFILSTRKLSEPIICPRCNVTMKESICKNCGFNIDSSNHDLHKKTGFISYIKVHKMQLIIVVSAICISIIAISIIANQNHDQAGHMFIDAPTVAPQSETKAMPPANVINTPAPTKFNADTATTAIISPIPVPTANIPVEVAHRGGMYGISDKDISEWDITSIHDVRNDKTGNWKICLTTVAEPIEEYVLSYYKEFFSRENELHWIVNFSLKTTTCIWSDGSYIYVDVHQYVNKEEHYAETLGTGTILSKFMVYKDNGDIEKIE